MNDLTHCLTDVQSCISFLIYSELSKPVATAAGLFAQCIHLKKWESRRRSSTNRKSGHQSQLQLIGWCLSILRREGVGSEGLHLASWLKRNLEFVFYLLGWVLIHRAGHQVEPLYGKHWARTAVGQWNPGVKLAWRLDKLSCRRHHQPAWVELRLTSLHRCIGVLRYDDNRSWKIGICLRSAFAKRSLNRPSVYILSVLRSNTQRIFLSNESHYLLRYSVQVHASHEHKHINWTQQTCGVFFSPLHNVVCKTKRKLHKRVGVSLLILI